MKRNLPAVLLSMAVVLVAGCGGGDSGTNPVPPASSQTGQPGTTTSPSGGTATTPPAGGATTTTTTTPPSGGTTTTTPPSGGTSTTAPAGIIPTWYGVQANILQKYCTVCHSGASAPLNLSWEVDRYDAIVTNGRMSAEKTTLREVDPGNPDASYVMWKIRGLGPTGQAIDGVRMPAFSAALDPALIDVMAQWIRNGAPLGTPADATSGSTTATTPPSGGTGTTTPPSGGTTTTTPPSGGTTTPPSGGTSTTTPSAIVPTWYGVQANVLQRYCTLCHSGASAPLGLSWEVDRYASIVTDGRLSGEISTMREVAPGNPDASYMMWKLRGQGPSGQAISGVRMPAFSAALDPALIDVVAEWIRSGAPLGVPSDATSGGTTTTTPTSPTVAASAISPTWYGVQVNILQRSCTACHGGYEAQAGLSWDFDQYSTVVTNGRLSTEMPSLREIEPGNPDASYMMWKLRGQGPAGQSITGARMPATGIALDPALIGVVEKWIRDGAPLGTIFDANAGGTVGPTYPVGSWMYVWSEALQVCSMCHSRTPANPRCGVDFTCPPNGVVLTADNYNGVVDGNVVRPFLPNSSKLWQRVAETDPAKRMPFGLKALSERQLEIISSWITNGAPLCPANAVCP